MHLQPVFYEFEAVKVPVLFLIGDKDRTTLGKGYTPPETFARLSDYPELGHAGWIQYPARVDPAIIGFLDSK